MTAHTLVITNDFPPRSGGIQTFVYELVSRFDPNTVTVLASQFAGDRAFDQQQPFEVVRANSSVLLPTSTTRALAQEVLHHTRATRVVYGAMAPLGLLAPAMAKAGAEMQIAISHGHEAGWAITPGLRQALHRIGDHVDRVTYLTQYTKSKIAPALSQNARSKMRQLTPGVDVDYFTPERQAHAAALRREFGIGQRPVIVCISRLMKRKGQDTLIAAMPTILREFPDAMLVIVGSGAYHDQLAIQVRDSGLTDSVLMTGEVPYADLPAWYAVGDVFAMPCRTRNLGWDVEGLGIVYLEASATGLPVIAGESGGAPDAVRDGITGVVVDGRDANQVAALCIAMLSNPEQCKSMGQAGREWTKNNWTWDARAARLQQMLAGWDVPEFAAGQR